MTDVLHEPLVVASHEDADLQTAHARAVEIFSSKAPRVEVDFPHTIGAVEVTPIIAANYNGGGMFMVPSPGSKANWSPAKDFGARVEEYIAWLHDACDWDRHYAKALRLEWAWTCFGGDGLALVRHAHVYTRRKTWGPPWGFVFGKPLVTEHEAANRVRARIITELRRMAAGARGNHEAERLYNHVISAVHNLSVTEETDGV